MANIINQWNGEVVVMGDFNEVRDASERYGYVFHAANALEFNDFIRNSHLHDIPLGGYAFTWTDKYATKISKIDRFLVLQGFLDLFPNMSGLILDRNISDHRPILLKEVHVDYGPSPFRLFHSWFLEEDFTSVLESSWNNDVVPSNNAMITLKNKLKNLKTRLKAWNRDKRLTHNQERKHLQESLSAIDARLDQGMGFPDDIPNRAKFAKDLGDLNKKDSIDLAQKAKVKWAIEGDENFKYFHGIVNKKRRSLAIKGILKDGEWIDNPNHVKAEFYHHFSSRFSQPEWARVPLVVNFPKRLSVDLASDLELEVSSDEIKKAVWDCGLDKSPGPDGFTFEFFKKHWSIVGCDVISAIKEFFSSSSIPNGCNASFIALIPKVLDAKHLNDFRPISLVGCQYKIIGKILASRLSNVMEDIISPEQSAFVKGRQIMDGPIILNEIVSWCKSKKEQTLLFKVDFQKAFDSVRWDHLDDILGKFGFGHKWRGWIKGCLSSSKASVLVNGAPTDEFMFHRGLRQGDPLSPFLFILVMESLHISFQRLIDQGMFAPLTIGNGNQVVISHLFYADDAIFIGKWTRENVNALMLMLHCFFLSSGLKINVHKSSIFGIGVRLSQVNTMAALFGCTANSTPFTYLGVKVGANMKRTSSWDVVVNKVTSKLSSWKAKTLSVGGRLTLIKSVLGAIPTYYMSLFKAPEGVIKRLESIRNSFFIGADLGEKKMTWVSWRKTLAHKDRGGLGIHSLYALNHALLFKWIWRFKASHSSLWVNVIKAIHGSDGSLNSASSNHGFSLVLGNGHYIKFWHGEVPFKDAFKRCYNLELQKDITVASKFQSGDLAFTFRRHPRSGIEEFQLGELSRLTNLVILSNSLDRWSWSLCGSGNFSVKSAREYIDQHYLISSPSPTIWSKVIPIKLNVFKWRLALDKLPTRNNLASRGIMVPCHLCPICNMETESRDHLFFRCSIALDLTRLLSRWWNLQIPLTLDYIAWGTWIAGLRLKKMQKLVLEACFTSLWWHIWVFRNAFVFSDKKPLKGLIFDNFVSQSYVWVVNRCKSIKCTWVDWLRDPLDTFSM
ncbi:RNA-directed DNA polymerase, eukaryota [Tanacetum coccineum]